VFKITQYSDQAAAAIKPPPIQSHQTRTRQPMRSATVTPVRQQHPVASRQAAEFSDDEPLN
jgi:hypothetical protein